MFSIYLLEDNSSQRNHYKRIIENWIMINDFSMKLKESYTVKSFYDGFEKEQYGLFFLDMDIDGDVKAGLKVADYIRKDMPDAKIVFITTHDELSFLTLERRISPMDYILKDSDPDEIKSRILKDMGLAKSYYENSIYEKEKIFGYKIGSKYFSVPMKELILLYTDKESPGRVTLESDKRVASFPGNLTAIEKKYNNLLRVDKSYLVNTDRMDSYDAKSKILYLDNDINCYVSYRKSTEVSKFFK